MAENRCDGAQRTGVVPSATFSLAARPLLLVGLVALALPSPTFAQPSNDDCSSPLPAVLSSNYTPINFLVATNSPPAIPCAIPNDLWFELTATFSASLEVFVNADGGAAAIYLIGGGCPGPADLITCGVDTNYLDVTAGETYLIQVGASAPSAFDSLLIDYATPPGVPDDRFTLEIEPQTVAAGVDFNISVLLSSVPGTQGPAIPIGGWAYGVCVDPTEFEVLEIEQGAGTLTANGGSPTQGYFEGIDPGVGFWSGAVVNFTGMNALPPGVDIELNVVTCRSVGAAAFVGLLEFCDSVADPPINTTIAFGVQSPDPVTIAGEITVTSSPSFRRGDTNVDGSVNIADTITILNYLFPQGAPQIALCALAFDANDDETINIADAITIQSALFGSMTVPLPPPVCGADPTGGGGLDCQVESSCP